MELRHLRYFVAVVDWKGYRQASAHLHIAQPAISTTLSNLEVELAVKLFAKTGRSVTLTPEGKSFYADAVRILAQADHAVDAVQRAARGEIGEISVGYCGASNYSFLPDIVREYRRQFPNVKLRLQELTAGQQEQAFAEGSLDVGIVRPFTLDMSGYCSRVLFEEHVFAAISSTREIKHKMLRIEGLARERFILFYRKGGPALYDSIIGLCNEHGFSPTIDSSHEMMQTVLTLVAADQGISIVPACALSLPSAGIRFLPILPDSIRAQMVVVWRETLSATPIVQSFLNLLEENQAEIRTKTQIKVSN